jgi:hypothetical protein
LAVLNLGGFFRLLQKNILQLLAAPAGADRISVN